MLLPAYNEAGCLPGLFDAYRRLFRRHPALRGTIIVVDDGSRDETASIAEAAKADLPIHLVRHPKNRGLGEAIKTGLREAARLSAHRDDVLVCMDADDTHPPDHIPSMLKEVARGADVVIASRYRPGSRQHGVPLNRQAMSLVARMLFQVILAVPGVRDYTCGYRAYRMQLVRDGLDHYGNAIITRSGFACTDQLLVNFACIGARFREVPFILRYDKKVGPSKLNLGVTVLETFALLLDARRKLAAAKARKYTRRPRRT